MKDNLFCVEEENYTENEPSLLHITNCYDLKTGLGTFTCGDWKRNRIINELFMLHFQSTRKTIPKFVSSLGLITPSCKQEKTIVYRNIQLQFIYNIFPNLIMGSNRNLLTESSLNDKGRGIGSKRYGEEHQGIKESYFI